MRHQFQRQEIPAGKGSVDEDCPCGAKSRRYRSGPRLYIGPDGKTGGKAIECTLEKAAPEERSEQSCARKVIPITQMTPPPPLPDAVNFLATYEAKHQQKLAERAALDRRPSDLSETEAQLKDAYVIINLLYEDLVTAGIRSPGRGMAGRLLYSAGYTEKVKKLERQ